MSVIADAPMKDADANPPPHSSAPAVHGARRRPSRRAVGWSIAAVVVILIVAWQVAVATSVQAVKVTMDSRPLICARGQEVTRDLSGHFIELARLTPALDCNLRIHIYNDGVLPVHLDDATFVLLGSEGVTAHVDIIDGQPSHDVSEGDAFGDEQGGLDEVGRFQDGDLAPGQAYILVAHISPSKETCYSAGGSISFPYGTPSIGVTALGITEARQPVDVEFGFLGTKQSTDKSCAK
jgi:hypothetical protein